MIRIWVKRLSSNLCNINSSTLSRFPSLLCKPSLISPSVLQEHDFGKGDISCCHRQSFHPSSEYLKRMFWWFLWPFETTEREFLPFEFLFFSGSSWASLPSAFPRWTALRFCCTIITSIWMNKSSWKASACTRGSSQL